MGAVSRKRLPDTALINEPRAFGAFVRGARSTSGLSIEDAATALGVAKQTLSNLETEGASVRLGIALKAAHEFGLAVFVVPAAERDRVARFIETVRGGDVPATHAGATRRTRKVGGV